MLAWGLLRQLCRRGPVVFGIRDGATQRQIRKQGIIMRQDLFLNIWDSCSLTIAATMSVDSNFVRSAEMSPANVKQLPGEGNSSQFKLSHTPRNEDKNAPREASGPWLNFVI